MLTKQSQARIHLVFLSILTFLTLAFSFQNCSLKLDQGQKDDNFTAKGNGEAYNGKMTYVNRRDDTKCSDGSDVQTKIEVDSSNNAYLTRTDCQDIQPRVLDFLSLGLMPHNLANLTYANRVFDQQVTNLVSTGLFCRGSNISIGATSAQSQIVIPDVVLKNFGIADSTPFPGHVILGFYDAQNNYLRKLDSGETQFHKVDNPGGDVDLIVLLMDPNSVGAYVGRGSDDSYFKVGVKKDLNGALTAQVIYNMPGSPQYVSGNGGSGAIETFSATCYTQTP